MRPQGPTLEDTFRELEGLVNARKLKLYIQISAPRTGSNFIAKMFSQSLDIDYVATLAPNITYGAGEYLTGISNVYHSIAAQKKDSTPTKIYIKDQAAFIPKELWPKLVKLSEGVIAVTRDPLMQATSELTAMCDDTRLLEDRVRQTAPGSTLQQVLKESGFETREAFDAFCARAKTDGNYTEANRLLSRLWPDEHKAPTDFPNNREFRSATLVRFSAQCYADMAQFMKSVPKSKAIIPMPPPCRPAPTSPPQLAKS